MPSQNRYFFKLHKKTYISAAWYESTVTVQIDLQFQDYLPSIHLPTQKGCVLGDLNIDCAGVFSQCHQWVAFHFKITSWLYLYQLHSLYLGRPEPCPCSLFPSVWWVAFHFKTISRVQCYWLKRLCPGWPNHEQAESLLPVSPPTVLPFQEHLLNITSDLKSSVLRYLNNVHVVSYLVSTEQPATSRHHPSLTLLTVSLETWANVCAVSSPVSAEQSVISRPFPNCKSTE